MKTLLTALFIALCATRMFQPDQAAAQRMVAGCAGCERKTCRDCNPTGRPSSPSFTPGRSPSYSPSPVDIINQSNQRFYEMQQRQTQEFNRRMEEERDRRERARAEELRQAREEGQARERIKEMEDRERREQDRRDREEARRAYTPPSSSFTPTSTPGTVYVPLFVPRTRPEVPPAVTYTPPQASPQVMQARQTRAQTINKQLQELEAKHYALSKEKIEVIAQLRAGTFCNKCRRTRVEIEKGGESFGKHLGRVQGSSVPVSDEEVARVAAKYDAEINGLIRQTTETRQLLIAANQEAAQTERDRSEQDRMIQQRLDAIETERRQIAQARYAADQATAPPPLARPLLGDSLAAIRGFAPTYSRETPQQRMLADVMGGNTAPGPGLGNYLADRAAEFLPENMRENFTLLRISRDGIEARAEGGVHSREGWNRFEAMIREYILPQVTPEVQNLNQNLRDFGLE